MGELNLVVYDLSFRERVGYTYERDDGLVRSWIDHIKVQQEFTVVHALIGPKLLLLTFKTTAICSLNLLFHSHLRHAARIIGML